MTEHGQLSYLEENKHFKITAADVAEKIEILNTVSKEVSLGIR